MKDLTINVDGELLNCRAGAIINHNGKILLHKNTADVYYALVGGRVQIGESSDDTIRREIKEEIGKDVEITGYIATVENFFELKGKKYHEIMFIHQAEFTNNEDKKIVETLQNIEGNIEKHIQYEWIDLDKIEDCPLRPEIIKNVLKEGKFPTHVINKERDTK